MGIILKQSLTNTITTFIGFAIGAVNALFMYTHFLGEEFYGLTAYILSTANIVMPLMAFGIQNTLVKFYAEHESEDDKSRFLNFVLVLPLVVIIPAFAILFGFYEPIAQTLSTENIIIYDYVWMIPLIGLFMGYFEIFYAWVKVQMKSVTGNFIKEVLLRILISLLLFAVYLDFINNEQFVYSLLGIYAFTMIVMAFIAFRIRRPEFHLRFPRQKREIIIYSGFIIFSSGIAVLLLDIDKFMIGQYIPIEEAAFYSVAIFMALTISVPMRAMHQITHPITTELMALQKWEELNELYKKTSITLQVIGGWIMLGILTNIHDIYALLPESYSGGISVVFIIAFSKYFDVMLGNNNSIIFNSKYYRTVLILGLCLVVVTVTLNRIFIPLYGISGAAWATLISIGFYSLAKALFVVLKMKLFPFTFKTLGSIIILATIFILFYPWSFGFHPVLNILLKSVLISILYIGVHFYTRISEDINVQLIKYLPFLRRLSR